MFLRGFPIRILLAIGLALGAGGTLRGAATEDDKEYQLRAAFLLNFMKFTTWPEGAFAEPSSDLIFTIVGDDPYGRILEQTFGRENIQGRHITIERFELPTRDDFSKHDEYDDAVAALRRNIKSAHVLHFTWCDQAQLDLVLEGVDRKHMLTIGDQRGCAEHVTALALERDGDRIVFYANLGEIEDLKLQVSSRLLSLARIIERKGSDKNGKGK